MRWKHLAPSGVYESAVYALIFAAAATAVAHGVGGWQAVGCLARLLVSGPAAAWVQTIGTLIALGVAIYVGKQPDRIARTQAAEAAAAFGLCFRQVMTSLIESIDFENPDRIAEDLAKMREAVEIGRTVPLHLLDYSQLLAVRDLRLLAVQTVATLELQSFDWRHPGPTRHKLVRMAGRANLALLVATAGYTMNGEPLEITWMED